MGVREHLENLFQHNSPKYICIKDSSLRYTKFFLYLILAVCVCCLVMICRLFEKTDKGNSSVRINVKGVAYSNNRTWDTAEYTMPTQAINSFFVITNIIQTENQVEQECPEYPYNNSLCSSDEFCENGSAHVFSNGVQTGRCVNYNETVKTCEVKAWCPVQSSKIPPKPAVLRSSENFTMLIKNNIYFPKFDHTVTNIPEPLDTSCKYNKKTSPDCPIFRLGDILQEAKENFSEIAVTGGLIAIEINWDCNLNSWLYSCKPVYDFRRLDDRNRSPGFSFRTARYYKLPNGVEQRTLSKVYGIRFDVHVFVTGRRFSIIELIKSSGSMISYSGLVVAIIEFVIFVCNYCSSSKSSFYKIYNRKKYDIVMNPSQVMYVSFVDEPHVTFVNKPLKTSLQHAQGHIVESHSMRFCDTGIFCHSVSNRSHGNEVSEPTRTSQSNRSHDNVVSEPTRTSQSNRSHDDEVSEPTHTSESKRSHDDVEKPRQRPMQETISLDCQDWCCCGKCQPSQEYREQLCCRRQKGDCITNTAWFQQLVLSHHNIKSALLYTNPFENLEDENINTRLRDLAYKQYIHWRFGSFDLEDGAIIPSCCRWKIRDTYKSM